MFSVCKGCSCTQQIWNAQLVGLSPHYTWSWQWPSGLLPYCFCCVGLNAALHQTPKSPCYRNSVLMISLPGPSPATQMAPFLLSLLKVSFEVSVTLHSTQDSYLERAPLIPILIAVISSELPALSADVAFSSLPPAPQLALFPLLSFLVVVFSYIWFPYHTIYPFKAHNPVTWKYSFVHPPSWSILEHFHYLRRKPYLFTPVSPKQFTSLLCIFFKCTYSAQFICTSHKTHGLLLLVIKIFSIKFSKFFPHVFCLHKIVLSRPPHYLPTDGHCITSIFGILRVMLIWILMLISFKYTYGSRARGRLVTVCLVTWKTMKMSSSMAVPYYISTPNMALAISFNFVNTYYYWIFDFKYTGKCEMAMSFVFKEILI